MTPAERQSSAPGRVATAPGERVAIAPGKAVLCGEYAVLEGAPAISAAVDRVVIVRPASRGEPPSPFVRAAIDRAQAHLHEQGLPPSPVAAVAVDSTQLYDGGQKIGFGSSAAVTAATCALVLASGGLPIDDRPLLFRIADEAHAAAQGPGGSGVDVATAVFGGIIRFQRAPGGQAIITPVDLPDGVRTTFIYTGKSASTADLLGRVRALAVEQPSRHEAAFQRLGDYARAFASAVADNDAGALLRAVYGYRESMIQLGEVIGCELVTRAHTQLAALARRHGGAAKPSGAGGGDLGVAFTVGAEATRALRDDLKEAGLTPIALGAPPSGVRLATHLDS